MKSLKGTVFSCLITAVALVTLACSGPLATRNDSENPAAATAQGESGKIVGLKGDTAFFSYYYSDSSDTEYDGISLAIKSIDQTISPYPMQLSVRASEGGWEEASISKAGYIVQIGGRGPAGIAYRIGRVLDANTDVSWIRSGMVTTIPVYANDYDVSINDKNKVVFVWSSNNWANAYYSSAVINEESITGLNWSKNNVQFYAAGGLFHNMRISFGGSNGDVIGIIYKPGNASLRYFGCGSFNGADGSISWYLDNPQSFTRRDSGDGIYDIAMDYFYDFSIVWATNQGNDHYAYHVSGVKSGQSLLANGAQTELCHAKNPPNAKYTYINSEVGRSSDGRNVVITIPQNYSGDGLFKTQFSYALGTVSATCTATGALCNIQKNGRSIIAHDGDYNKQSTWPGYWADDAYSYPHLAY